MARHHAGDGEPYAALKPVTAVWILAVPICDSVSLMLRRVRRGRSPFKPDREHLHHLLQDADYTIYSARFFARRRAQ